jgi:tRNA modification GTPase
VRADTIYALSTGSPPAGIAVVRVSGPAATEALRRLAGRVPEPRRASAATIKGPDGEILDRGLILFFPGPATATGEDVAELHLHGGRAVVASVLAALGKMEDLRSAEAGEFTRRAFDNGRIDLAEAEGLADLLSAETEAQRRAALALAGGALSRRTEDWQRRLLAIAAQVEAAIDFSDEDDVKGSRNPEWRENLVSLSNEVRQTLAAPAIERLKEGLRVVIAGPPNAGKSTLLNALSGREAAITSPVPGTTRDVVEAPTAINGSAFLLIDTAGLRETEDQVEVIGVERAKANVAAADMVLWLGERNEAPTGNIIVVQAKADLDEPSRDADLRLSARTGAGMDELFRLLAESYEAIIPGEGEVALNARHRTALGECINYNEEALQSEDPLIVAEALRQARVALDTVTGRAGVEEMLDSLFSRFCIGK